MRANPNEVVGIFGDEVNAGFKCRGGSESAETKALKNKGEEFRKTMRDKLEQLGFRRPRANWFRTQTGRMQLT